MDVIGRSERIRTSGPCLPKTVLYQAELHSDQNPSCHSTAVARGERPYNGMIQARQAGLKLVWNGALNLPGEAIMVRHLARDGPRLIPAILTQMGRSQVVRQRFLVSPFAGSIPAAPAIL